MTWFKSIWLILTLKCNQSTQLASESLDRDLTRAESVAMRLHELLCGHCRRFHEQIVALGEAARLRRSQGTDLPGSSLSSEARMRIADSLNRATDHESAE